MQATAAAWLWRLGPGRRRHRRAQRGGHSGGSDLARAASPGSWAVGGGLAAERRRGQPRREVVDEEARSSSKDVPTFTPEVRWQES